MLVALVAVLVAVRARRREGGLVAELTDARAQLEAVRDVEERYRGVVDLEGAIAALRQERDKIARYLDEERAAFLAERAQLHDSLEGARRDLGVLTEQQYFADFGLYEPRYDFENAERYKEALERQRAEQKAMVKDGTAAVCRLDWTVGGSAAEGRKMVKNQLKLLLRAFNGECDAAIAKVRYNNVELLAKRILKAREALDKLGQVKGCSITDDYVQLKLAELHLFHEYQERKQAEKEEQRRIKEEMREEKKAQMEMERAKKAAEEEELRYERALEKARREVDKATGARHAKLLREVDELQRRLAEAHANKERAIARAQMTRSGHVYVISNIGSFGERVFKIGMTRRLDPSERVKELGDASVPFPFDVHAMIFTEDAPGLERELHRRFEHRRVNRVNERKEFFEVSIDEIAREVHALHAQVEFTMLAEAVEYRKSEAKRAKEKAAGPVPPSSQSPDLVPA